MGLAVNLAFVGASSALGSESLDAMREYWVSIASFKAMDQAENGARQASERLPDSFSVAPATTPNGFFYRVVAGPYLSREIADHMLEESRRNGYTDAWIFSEEGLSVSGLVDDSELSYSLARESEDRMPLEMSDIPARSPQSAAPASPPQKTKEIVQKAPEGYSFNRLRRH